MKIAPAVVEEVLREELPWIAWLPVDEQSHCVAELLTDLGAGLSVENFSRFHDDMVAWRSTSAVWADPTLAEDLQRELNGNAGSVERPGIG